AFLGCCELINESAKLFRRRARSLELQESLSMFSKQVCMFSLLRIRQPTLPLQVVILCPHLFRRKPKRPSSTSKSGNSSDDDLDYIRKDRIHSSPFRLPLNVHFNCFAGAKRSPDSRLNSQGSPQKRQLLLRHHAAFFLPSAVEILIAVVLARMGH